MQILQNRDTVELSEMHEAAYMIYALMTITDRALPDARDGLKPVHRRILYAMHDMGLTHDRPYRKSARVVGEVLGKYHPHGDKAVYDAMVRLAQDFVMREMLVDGQGNFGSIDGDSAAAMRYTEARMAKIAGEVLRDIEKETVDWIPNFDNSLKEPTVLPARFPNLLVNGTWGIAVGMASKIPPHNLGEVCDAVVHVANRWRSREKISVDELMKIIPGPDFPTGGIVYRYRDFGEGEVDAIRQAYETGRGKLLMQGRVDIEGRKLVITELPYGVNKSTLLSNQIADKVRTGKMDTISDVRDESDYEGMRVVITPKRGVEPRECLHELLSGTQLRETFGMIALALVPMDISNEALADALEDTRVAPRTLTLREMLVEFVEHRLDVIVRRSKYELRKAKERSHILEGYLIAIDPDNIDAVIDTIRRSRTRESAHANLMKRFGMSEIQANAVLDLRLARLTQLEGRKIKEEHAELQKRIKYLEAVLKSQKKQLEVVVEETEEIKKEFATPRRTVILDRPKESGITEEDLLMPEGDQVVAISVGGIERADRSGYNSKYKGSITSRSVNATLFQLETGPEDSVVMVTDAGRVWHGPVYRVLARATWEDMGLGDGEKVVGAGTAPKGRDDLSLLIGTRQGNVKRVEWKDIRDGMSECSWLKIIGLTEEDSDGVLFAGMVDSGAQAMFFTADGQAIRFEAEVVNPQATPSAKGVSGIKLDAKDRLVSGGVIGGKEEESRNWVVIVSESGFAKKVPLAEFPVQGRGGKGVQSLKITGSTGRVAAAAVVPDGDWVSILSAKGRRQLIPLSELPAEKRPNRGALLVDEFKQGEGDGIERADPLRAY